MDVVGVGEGVREHGACPSKRLFFIGRHRAVSLTLPVSALSLDDDFARVELVEILQADLRAISDPIEVFFRLVHRKVLGGF